jgi:enoyl-CoA hydratase/carnithine racemase
VHKIEYLKDFSDVVTSVRKLIIAQVAGFALVDGFEHAMMFDIISAADDAKFGLPELSVIGGT